MNLKINLLLTFVSASLFADTTFIKPDKFNQNNNCIVITKKQKYLGLNRFNTKEEFKKYCNGKMIFIYKTDKCRIFTMNNMKFDIYIEDKRKKIKFRINEIKKVCGKIIVESL